LSSEFGLRCNKGDKGADSSTGVESQNTSCVMYLCKAYGRRAYSDAIRWRGDGVVSALVRRSTGGLKRSNGVLRNYRGIKIPVTIIVGGPDGPSKIKARNDAAAVAP
jgi:hypothetical protein